MFDDFRHHNDIVRTDVAAPCIGMLRIIQVKPEMPTACSLAIRLKAEAVDASSQTGRDQVREMRPPDIENAQTWLPMRPNQVDQHEVTGRMIGQVSIVRVFGSKQPYPLTG